MVQNTVEKYTKKSKRKRKRNKIDQEILKNEDLEYFFFYVLFRRLLVKGTATRFCAFAAT